MGLPRRLGRIPRKAIGEKREPVFQTKNTTPRPLPRVTQLEMVKFQLAQVRKERIELEKKFADPTITGLPKSKILEQLNHAKTLYSLLQEEKRQLERPNL